MPDYPTPVPSESPLEELHSDLERAEYLQNLLIAEATGGNSDTEHYQELRRHFMNAPGTRELLPGFVRTNRDLSQFWQFIKYEYKHYAERRECIWKDFAPLLNHLEANGPSPADQLITENLSKFDSAGVHVAWSRALERKTNDPEGAITAARTLLETVCKHILDERAVSYDGNRIEVHELYKLTAAELSLSPSQHSADVFKQILGGCSALVNGLGTLRNRLGDAHGKGKLQVRPAERHAELAVNLAGSVAIFLVATHKAGQNQENA